MITRALCRFCESQHDLILCDTCGKYLCGSCNEMIGEFIRSNDDETKTCLSCQTADDLKKVGGTPESNNKCFTCAKEGTEDNILLKCDTCGVHICTECNTVGSEQLIIDNQCLNCRTDKVTNVSTNSTLCDLCGVDLSSQPKVGCDICGKSFCKPCADECASYKFNLVTWVNEGWYSCWKCNTQNPAKEKSPTDNDSADNNDLSLSKLQDILNRIDLNNVEQVAFVLRDKITKKETTEVTPYLFSTQGLGVSGVSGSNYRWFTWTKYDIHNMVMMLVQNNKHTGRTKISYESIKDIDMSDTVQAKLRSVLMPILGKILARKRYHCHAKAGGISRVAAPKVKKDYITIESGVCSPPRAPQ